MANPAWNFTLTANQWKLVATVFHLFRRDSH
jgi:hypothetical protein